MLIRTNSQIRKSVYLSGNTPRFFCLFDFLVRGHWHTLCQVTVMEETAQASRSKNTLEILSTKATEYWCN